MSLTRDPDLIAALVGPNNRSLYRRSVAFKSAVDQLAAMLPAMVDGLAEHARAHEDDYRKRLQAALDAPPLLAASILGGEWA